MEVLKHGWKWKEDNGIAECRCGCEFKYDDSDLRTTERFAIDIDGSHKYALLMGGITSNKCIEGYDILICPECGDMISMGLKYRKEYNGETAHKRDDGTVIYIG